MTNNETTRGFTLIETLLAVTILATAIAGPLTIASKGLTTALVAKDQTTALYLAQDAVEYIRFLRDSNRLEGTNWKTGRTDGGAQVGVDITSCDDKGCQFDSIADPLPPNTPPKAPQACPAAGCARMLYDTATHRFNYDSSDSSNKASPYFRTVTLVPSMTNTDEAILTVRVVWMDLPGVSHTVTVREDILDWQ